MSNYFLWIPLILWLLWNINFAKWLLDSIKRKIDYEIAMSIAMELLITTICLNCYLDPLIYENLLLQIIGCSIMWFVFFFIYIYQRILIKKMGQGPPEDYEDTTVLIKSGWFKIMRHPMFFGGILSNIGCLLVRITWLSFICVPISIGLCVISSFWEDKINIKKFGEEYKDYMKTVKRFGFI